MFWQAYRYILQNMDKKDSHIELLDRFFRGLTSPEEDVQLKSWIKQPDFQQKFSAYYQQCWALAPDTMDKAVQNEMFTELLSQIDASSTTETKVLKTRNRFLRQIGRYAAVACIILAVGSGAYYAFLNIGDFYDDGYCIVSSNGKLGVIDKAGRFVIRPEYDGIENSGGGDFSSYSQRTDYYG